MHKWILTENEEIINSSHIEDIYILTSTGRICAYANDITTELCDCGTSELAESVIYELWTQLGNPTLTGIDMSELKADIECAGVCI